MIPKIVLFVTASLVGALPAGALAQQPQSEWFAPWGALPTNSSPGQPNQTHPPLKATVVAETLVCPALRDLMYFYQSALNLGDVDDIQAFVVKHHCLILSAGLKIPVLGFGQFVSGISLGGSPMFVMTSAIQGP